jgi:hypothetical protein
MGEVEVEVVVVVVVVVVGEDPETRISRVLVVVVGSSPLQDAKRLKLSHLIFSPVCMVHVVPPSIKFIDRCVIVNPCKPFANVLKRQKWRQVKIKHLQMTIMEPLRMLPKKVMLIIQKRMLQYLPWMDLL